MTKHLELAVENIQPFPLGARFLNLGLGFLELRHRHAVLALNSARGGARLVELLLRDHALLEQRLGALELGQRKLQLRL